MDNLKIFNKDFWRIFCKLNFILDHIFKKNFQDKPLYLSRCYNGSHVYIDFQNVTYAFCDCWKEKTRDSEQKPNLYYLEKSENHFSCEEIFDISPTRGAFIETDVKQSDYECCSYTS